MTDGRVIRASESKRFRLRGLRQRTTDRPGVRHNRHHLVWMFFNDASEPTEDSCVQLGVAFGTGNFAPLLVFMHFNNFGVILMSLYPKEATFPIPQVNLP